MTELSGFRFQDRTLLLQQNRIESKSMS